jgi:hypothetical protein
MADNSLSSDDPKARLVPERPELVAASSAQAEVVRVAAIETGAPAGGVITTAMDEAAKREFLWHTHQYLNEYARFGDSKVGFAGIIASALLGALFTAKMHLWVFAVPFSQWQVATWMAAVGGVCLIVSTVLAAWVVIPRLRTTQETGFVYWQNLAAHGEAGVLQTSFHSQSERTLNDHLLHHNFDLSTKVLMPKYRAIAWCFLFLSAGAVLSASALVCRDVQQSSGGAVKASSAPPCRNGASTCEPWERDWVKGAPPVGTVVTKDGQVRTPSK